MPTWLRSAEDLRRFQAREPIVARPVSRPERLWRWCVRNPVVAALGAAAALLLFAVASISAASAAVIYEQNQNLKSINTALGESNIALGKATTQAEKRRVEAEQKQKLAEKAAWAANEQNRNAVDSEVALLDLLENRLRYVPAVEDVRKEVLDRTITRLDATAHSMTSLRKEIGWDPKDEENNWKSLARAHQRLAELSLSNYRFADALEQLKRMDALIETRAKDDPGDLMRQIRLARSRRQLGFVAMNRLGDAAACSGLHAPGDRDRSGLPGEEARQRRLQDRPGQLAGSNCDGGKAAWASQEGACALFGEEEELRKSLSKEFGELDEHRRQLAGMYEQLGDLKVRMSEQEEGRRLYDLSAKIRAEILARRPGDWPCILDLVLSYTNASLVRYPQGKEPAAAREFLRKALALVEERASTDPSNMDTKAVLARTLYYDATCAPARERPGRRRGGVPAMSGDSQGAGGGADREDAKG